MHVTRTADPARAAVRRVPAAAPTAAVKQTVALWDGLVDVDSNEALVVLSATVPANVYESKVQGAGKKQLPEQAKRRVGQLEVYRFIGVWQQDSGKEPRLGDGAAYCVPDLTPHTLSP